MTTKGLLRKQVIIPMNGDNTVNFMKESSKHIFNMNRNLKNAKSEVLVDFIWSDQSSIMVVTYKVASPSDLQIIENYVKNVEYIDVSHLLQSKFYLKIISISYYPYDNQSLCLSSNDIEVIIKQNQIFDNVVLASKPYIIKVSLKLNIFII